MITKVVRGWRVGGVVAYLMGPGKAQEHVNPRVIATWDGRDAAWQPGSVAAVEAGTDLGFLTRALRAPAIAAGLANHRDPDRQGYVWHCSARNAAGDRVLGDTEWAEIARELLDGCGVARRGDAGGPRWVAIRHAEDHIHIAVVLIRQDTCGRIWPWQDFPRLRVAARRIEQRLGLTPTAAADGTASRAPQRAEIEKAQREGTIPARTQLQQVVRATAGAVTSPDAFFASLEAAGVVAVVRRGAAGNMLGYKVARAGDLNREGQPVFYSGATLAPELSLPQLLRAWAQASAGAETGDAVDGARRRLGHARSAVAAARRGQRGEDPHDLAPAALEVVVALRGWGPELDHAADRFARAARAPRGTRPRPGATGAGLRRVARQLVRARRFTPADPGAAGVALIVALAALITEIAAWLREGRRSHQAAAAQEAADALGRWVTRSGGARPDGRGRGRERDQAAAARQIRREHGAHRPLP